MNELLGINLSAPNFTNVSEIDTSQIQPTINKEIYASQNTHIFNTGMDQGVNLILSGVGSLFKAVISLVNPSTINTPVISTGSSEQTSSGGGFLDSIGNFFNALPSYIDKASNIFSAVSSVFSGPSSWIGAFGKLFK